MSTSKSKFHLKKVDNETLDQCIGTATPDEQEISERDEPRSHISIGKFDLNRLKHSSRTLGVITLTSNSAIIVEDRCIRTIFKSSHLRFKVTSEIYDSPLIVQYSPELVDGKWLVVFTNKKEVVYYRVKMEISNVTLLRDIPYGTRPLELMQLPECMLVCNGKVWFVNRNTQYVMCKDENSSDYMECHVGFPNFQNVVHCSILNTTFSKILVLFFHVDVQSSNLRLEVFEPHLNENGDMFSISRIQTLNLGKSNGQPSYFYKFDSNSLIVIDSNMTVIVSNYPIKCESWENEGLVDFDDNKILCVNVIKKMVSSQYAIDIVCSDMAVYKGVLNSHKKDVKWKLKYTGQPNINASFASILRDGTVVFRNSEKMLNVSSLLIDGKSVVSSVGEFDTKSPVDYERIVYYGASQRNSIKSVLSQMIYCGVNLTTQRPFIETCETILKSSHCTYVTHLDEIEGTIDHVDYSCNMFTILAGNALYHLNADNQIYDIEKDNTKEMIVAEDGTFIIVEEEDVIYTTNVQMLTPVNYQRNVELYLFKSGRVKVVAFGHFGDIEHVYYDEVHAIHNTVNLVVAAGIDGIDNMVLLINEDSGLNIYRNGKILYSTPSPVNVIERVTILDIGVRGGRGCMVLFYGDGILLYKDLSLTRTYLKLDPHQEGHFRIIPRFSDYVMSIVYNERNIYLVSYLDFRIIRIPISLTILNISFNTHYFDKRYFELFVVDSEKGLHRLRFDKTIDFDAPVQRTEYGPIGGVPIAVCAVDDMPGSNIVLTCYPKTNNLVIQCYNFDSNLFSPEEPLIENIDYSTLVFQPIKGIPNYPVPNLFVAYFERDDESYYHILHRKPGHLSLDVLLKGSLGRQAHSIEGNFTSGTKVSICFIGDMVEVKHFNVETNDNKIHMIETLVGRENFNDLKVTSVVDQIIPWDSRSKCQKIVPPNNNNEDVRLNRYKSNMVSNVNNKIFQSGILLKKMCLHQHSNRNTPSYLGVCDWAAYTTLFKTLSQSNNHMNEDRGHVSLSVDINNSLYLTCYWGDEKLNTTEIYSQRLIFPPGRPVKNIIPYPDKVTLTTRFVAKDPQGREIFYEFKPLFVVLGENTTRFLIGECDRVTTSFSFWEDDYLPKELSTQKITLRSNAGASFSIECIELTD